MKRALVALGLWIVLVPRGAAADELEVNRTRSLSFSLAGGLAYVLSEGVFKEDLAPSGCRWCGDDLNPVDLNVRNLLVWDDPGLAVDISNGTGYVAAPVLGFGLLALAAWRDDATDQIVDDQLIVLEAAIGGALLNQTVKFIAGRERPFVRALPDEQKGLTDSPEDNNLSFFSGHTTFTFSLAVASGTVASLRGYRSAPWIWASGLTLAGATGYLRMAGDKHYFTDVLTGAVVGSFVGFAVPYWLHRGKSGESAAVGAAWSRGPLLSWSGTF